MSLCNDTSSTMLVQPANTGCNSGMGWGGDWSAWIIIFVLFFAFGGNGWGGFGGGAGNGALTRGELCQDMNFSDLESAVGRLSDNQALQFTQLNNGLCQLGYREAELASGINMNLAAGFANNATQLCQLGNNISNQFHAGQITQLQGQNAIQSQLAECCCTNRYEALQNANATQGAIRDGFCQTNYNAANNTRDIIEANAANTRAILDKLTQQELEAKNATIAAQNQALFAAELRASQEAQNSYLVGQLGQKCPIPAYITCNPFAPYNNTGCGCCGA